MNTFVSTFVQKVLACTTCPPRDCGNGVKTIAMTWHNGRQEGRDITVRCTVCRKVKRLRGGK